MYQVKYQVSSSPPAMPMTIEQARKMVAGTLKGNSAMSKAIQELITGEAAPPEAHTSPISAASSGERGAHTIAKFKAIEDSW